ncbi:15558_t:CDS:2, partial [Gigaspora margarita]
FEDIYLNYYSSLTIEQNSTNTENTTSIKNNALLYEDHIDDYYEYIIKQKQINQDIFCEFKQYIDEKKENNRYPTLAKMAHDFLVVPATSVALKQMFSCAGHIIDDYHTLLDPDTATALVCQ